METESCLAVTLFWRDFNLEGACFLELSHVTHVQQLVGTGWKSSEQSPACLDFIYLVLFFLHSSAQTYDFCHLSLFGGAFHLSVKIS